MHTLRSLRRSRALTIFDIARLTGIPVRVLAEVECGLQSLSDDQRAQVSFVFGMRDLPSPVAVQHTVLLPQATRKGLAAAALLAALAAAAARPAADVLHGIKATGSLASSSINALLPAAPAPRLRQRAVIAAPVPSITTTPTATASATASATPTPTASATPPPMASATATATPSAFLLTEQGPLGCPLRPTAGKVAITQGYGVGTHAPAETMGAVDLAIDGSETFGTVVVATHAGIARTQPNTWPTGNHIWVLDEASGWRTGYAHLSAFLVTDGQFVEAGTPIGLVGSTGFSTGPHLHYHVWHDDTNVDPTNLVAACFQ